MAKKEQVLNSLYAHRGDETLIATVEFPLSKPTKEARKETYIKALEKDFQIELTLEQIKPGLMRKSRWKATAKGKVDNVLHFVESLDGEKL